MLGERGLWFKMSFFEGSARVPLMISAPELPPGRIETAVSTIDLCPTLCELAGVSMEAVAPWTTGESLVALARGGSRTSAVAMEYAAEGSHAPLVALRKGAYKYTRCLLDPEQLFDLTNDPHELENLAADPAHAGTLRALQQEADKRWDLARFDRDVRRSQARRLIVYDALRSGAYYPWDYQPLQQASERYMRNHMNLNALEASQRHPKPE